MANFRGKKFRLFCPYILYTFKLEARNKNIRSTTKTIKRIKVRCFFAQAVLRKLPGLKLYCYMTWNANFFFRWRWYIIYNLFQNSKTVLENIIQYVLKIRKGCFLGHPVDNYFINYYDFTKLKDNCFTYAVNKPMILLEAIWY